MHDAQIFASLPLNGAMRNGLIPECKKVIVSSEDPVPICMLWVPAYPLLTFFIKEYANGDKTTDKHLFGCWLSSGKMMIECAFGD